MTTTEREPQGELLGAVAQRPDDLTEALRELSGLLLDSDTLQGTLQRVVDLAVRVVPGCTGAGVTLTDGKKAYTAAHSDPLVLQVDTCQYDAGDGPCLTAMRDVRTVRVDVAEAGEQWPDFTAMARRLGVRSFLAAPLVAAGASIGALNLYSSAADGYDALDESLVLLFSAQASVALANARLYDGAVRVQQQLTEALSSRAVIEQAKGVLMAQRGVDADAAFGCLREMSQLTNRKLRDVAADVVSGVVPDPV